MPYCSDTIQLAPRSSYPNDVIIPVMVDTDFPDTPIGKSRCSKQTRELIGIGAGFALSIAALTGSICLFKALGSEEGNDDFNLPQAFTGLACWFSGYCTFVSGVYFGYACTEYNKKENQPLISLNQPTP